MQARLVFIWITVRAYYKLTAQICGLERMEEERGDRKIERKKGEDVIYKHKKKEKKRKILVQKKKRKRKKKNRNWFGWNKRKERRKRKWYWL